jgi:ABC-2 type transport system ATP-binding protein
MATWESAKPGKECVLSTTEEVQTAGSSPEIAISVERLVKSYGDNVAVDHVSFEVKKGEIFAFLGPNGAGKSTTIEILECLRPLTQGKAFVLGYNITNPHVVPRIKERIGVLPQDFSALDRLTVKENLDLFSKMYTKSISVDELLSLLELSDKAKVRFGDLSGGLKQRVGVAAALVNDPDLVFLDEPTTGLDPDIRRTTWNILRSLAHSGKAIFLTTHYMEEAQALAERIGVIMKGKIVALGSPAELMDKFGGRKMMIFKGGGDRAYAALRTEFTDLSLDGDDVNLPFSSTVEIQRALSVLSKWGVGCEMEEKAPNMEDVFLKLTGYTIKAGGQAA